MITKELLHSDLKKFKEITDTEKDFILQESIIIQKLKDNEFDDVIHKLYTKDELESFLESHGLGINQLVDFDFFSEALPDIIDQFVEDFEIRVYDEYGVASRLIEALTILKAYLGESFEFDSYNEKILYSQASPDVTLEFEKIIKTVPSLYVGEPAECAGAGEWLMDHLIFRMIDDNTLIFNLDY